MAADGRKENNDPGWPLMNPQPVQAPTPTGQQPPSYAAANAVHPTMQIPKRRPLSSAMSNTPGRQPLRPVQDGSAPNTGPALARKSSFEVGDDAYLRKPGQSRQASGTSNPDQRQVSNQRPANEQRQASDQRLAAEASEQRQAAERRQVSEQRQAAEQRQVLEQRLATQQRQLSEQREASDQKRPQDPPDQRSLSNPQFPSERLASNQRVPSDQISPSAQRFPSNQRVSSAQQSPSTQQFPPNQRIIPDKQSPLAQQFPSNPRAPPEQRSLSDQRHPSDQIRVSIDPSPSMQFIPLRQRQTIEASESLHQPHAGVISTANGSTPSSRHTSGGSWMNSPPPDGVVPQPLQYHHQAFEDGANQRRSMESTASGKYPRRISLEVPPVPSSRRVSGETSSRPTARRVSSGPNALLGANLSRPQSAYSAVGYDAPGRTLSPAQQSLPRTPSPNNRTSPDNRLSYVDLLNVPYPQPPPATSNLDNAHLRSSVGQNASLLSTKKTLDMYRANVKKTSDPTIQYEFAIFMITSAQEQAAARGIDINSKPPQSPRLGSNGETSEASPQEMLREARGILQKLSDRSYPFAQYYLGDGYASGLFAKGNPDNDRAFPLFIAASKHGHAEAGYRAALCYEFGWGCRKDFQKAVQFYRQSASKSHPGAMSRLGNACLIGDMGLGHRQREGLTWLKRAAESADAQYNSAPYELGLLHESGYGDDIFKDESYAAQLFTQSAGLGHIEANHRLGEAYELGKLSCPKDPALSVHFYTGAATQGHPGSMMALCAWYMIGAEPALEKDENEAYQWARQAAERGLPKAEYAVGYFTEMGIGCRRDPLEANVWYVRAADQGDERAKHRIAAIRAAASGGGNFPPQSLNNSSEKGNKDKEGGKGKKWGIF